MIAHNVANVSEDSDYYQILGIPENASMDDIREAYEKQLESAHEESLAAYSLCPEEETEERLLELSLAYMKLADPDARLAYDQNRRIYAESLVGNPQIQEEPVVSVEKEKDSWKSRIRKVIYLRSSNPDSEKTDQPVHTILDNKFSKKEIKLPESLPDNSPRELDSKTLRDRQNVFRNLNQKNTSSQERLDTFYTTLDSQNGKTSYNGLVLKQIREIKSISLEELATVTCVRQIYLSGIENEDFSRFTSAVYFKGYLQCYAKALELPVGEVLNDFKPLIENAQWS